MPVHINAISRRRFLGTSLASVVGLTCIRPSFANTSEVPTDPNFFAWLSDTHISADRSVLGRGVNMFDHLQQVTGEILKLDQRPAGVLINGDCVYLKGLVEDYRTFAQSIDPLVQEGLPVHLTMGNHDNREALYEVIQQQRPTHQYVDGKHITCIETVHADLYLLDSLFETDVVTGEIGSQQCQWLDEALRASSEKPAIVIAHHPFQFTPPAEGKVWGGIRDTSEFYDVFKSHPKIKAFVFGHSHVWEQTKKENLHLINLPPVAYVFREDLPSGWVSARIQENGLEMRLHAIKKDHPRNEELVELSWS